MSTVDKLAVVRVALLDEKRSRFSSMAQQGLPEVVKHIKIRQRSGT